MTNAQSNDPSHHSLSQVAVSRLILAKQFYYHALEHSHRQGPLDKMIAIHNFHNSIEIMIRTVAMEYKTKSAGHDVTITKLDKEIAATPAAQQRGIVLPHMQRVFELSGWRNLAQHAATVPEQTVVDEWRSLTWTFLRDVSSTFLGLRIEDVTAASLIGNDEIRRLLERAEHLFIALSDETEPQSPATKSDVYQEALTALTIAFAFTFGAARWYLPFAVIEDLVDVPPELENQEQSTINGLLWTRIRNLELATVLPLLGIDYWFFQELTEYSPTVFLDSTNVAWILPQNEGEGDADADALQIRRLVDAQVNAVLSLEARGWLPKTIGLHHESPYDVAAAGIISGESPEIVGNLDQEKLPAKATMNLDTTIRGGFPEFMQDVYL